MNMRQTDILGIPSLSWYGVLLKKHDKYPVVPWAINMRRKRFLHHLKNGNVEPLIGKICRHDAGKTCEEAINRWLRKPAIYEFKPHGHGTVAGGTCRCSVIINTVDRAADLEITLRDLERQWNSAKDELIVVLGPSDDRSTEVVRNSKIPCKLIHCPERNLAISRNLGYRAAKGEYLAFIDDDASPAENWLDHLLKPLMDDPEAGCSAGFIMDGGGGKYLDRYVVADALGRAYRHKKAERAMEKIRQIGPDRAFYTATGCNMAFKREVIDHIGGFDPFYKYYLEETDVVNRARMMGFKCVPAKESIVFHRLSSNVVRNHAADLESRITVIRSQIHYIDKFGKSAFPETEIRGCVWRRMLLDLEKIAWDTDSGERRFSLQMEYLYSLAREFDGRSNVSDLNSV